MLYTPKQGVGERISLALNGSATPHTAAPPLTVREAPPSTLLPPAIPRRPSRASLGPLGGRPDDGAQEGQADERPITYIKSDAPGGRAHHAGIKMAPPKSAAGHSGKARKKEEPHEASDAEPQTAATEEMKPPSHGAKAHPPPTDAEPPADRSSAGEAESNRPTSPVGLMAIFAVDQSEELKRAFARRAARAGDAIPPPCEGEPAL